MSDKLQRRILILIAAFTIFRPTMVLATPGQILKFVLEPESSIRIFPDLLFPSDYEDPTSSTLGNVEQLSGYFVIKHAGNFEHETRSNQVRWKVKETAYDLVNLEFASPSVRISLSASNFEYKDNVEVVTLLACRYDDEDVCLNDDNFLTQFGWYPYSTFFDGDYLVNSDNVAISTRIWSDGTFTGSFTSPDSITLQQVHVTTGYPDFNYYADMKLKAVRESISVPEIGAAGLPLSVGLLLGLVMLFRERYRDYPVKS